MADCPFSIGDVVQLRSGGPDMTVTDTGQRDSGGWNIRALWFSETKFEHFTFTAEVLIEVGQ